MVYQNHAEIQYDNTFEQRIFLDTYLTATEVQKKMLRGRKSNTLQVRNVDCPLYEIHGDRVIFPRGFVEYFKDIKGVSLRNFFCNRVVVPKLSKEEIASSLQPEAGFDLRNDQITAVKKGLYLKRGIIQMPPGSGKTEVQASILRFLFKYNTNLKVLVLEPTLELGRGVLRRFNSYNLDATLYSENRSTSSSIVVAHVTSLLIDLKDNPNLLDNFNIVFWDEVHHSRCDTWLQLNKALRNVEYSLGFSALAIDEGNISDLSRMDLDERLIVGSTGSVLIHINSLFYIDKGILATPVIFQINNIIDRGLSGNKVWTYLFAEGISSADRNNRVADVVEFFYQFKRKVLVLVGTKEQAFVIAEMLRDKNKELSYGISFGNKVSYLNDTKVTDDIVSMFDTNDISILLATTHLDEGIDIKNLDVCILASGGKKDRRLIQRLGRVLRKTKKGRYAYIIDFADKGNGILSRHATYRLNLYKNLIEVPSDLIYLDQDIVSLRKNFIALEGLI